MSNKDTIFEREEPGTQPPEERSEPMNEQILYYHPESDSYFIDSADYPGSPGDDGLSVEIGKCDDLATLRRELEQAREQLSGWEEKEAACCPEDVGFDEYIKHLIDERDTARRELESAHTANQELIDANERVAGEIDTARMCLANEEQAHREVKAALEHARENEIHLISKIGQLKDDYNDIAQERDTARSDSEIARRSGYEMATTIGKLSTALQQSEAEAARLREARNKIDSRMHNVSGKQIDYWSGLNTALQLLDSALTTSSAPEKPKTCCECDGEGYVQLRNEFVGTQYYLQCDTCHGTGVEPVEEVKEGD